MAGDWIKLRTDLQDDPEVLRLSSMLKLDRFAVVGRLAALWGWADKHTTDGRACVTPLLLDELVGHAGFADAMTVVGWLEVDDRGVCFPRFNRHNGETAKKRALTARRVATHRKRKCNATVTQTPLAREEKRREEKNNTSPPAAVTVSALQADGLTEQTAAEFLQVRRRKRAPLTERAWDGIKAEAAKAGWTLEKAVCKALQRGWQSFEAEWVRGEAPPADKFAGAV